MSQPPELNIPSSTSTVQVRIIDTTSHISDIPLSLFITPEIPNFTTLSCPAFSFLIEHSSGSKLLFDLGVRRDTANFSPRIRSRIEQWTVTVRQGVREQLEQHGVHGADIDAIIWSHWHWDHTGDPSTFEAKTALVVGPGFKKNFIPAYPTNPDSPLLDSDFAGREVREIAFEGKQALKIGTFNAWDYFGDGSFYLLDSPGHAIGHLCGLARVTASPDSFIFMGGDACHHGGEFRPSQYLPFPASISPNPLDMHSPTPCPGALFEDLLRDGDGTKAFFEIAKLGPGKGATHDYKEAVRTIGKVQEADASDRILVVMAHDESLLPVVDFFPEYANGFMKKGWVEKGRWAFLKDFKGVIKK